MTLRKKVDVFDIGKAFIPHNLDERDRTVMIEISLGDVVDGYDYHDFPSSVHVFLKEEKIKELIRVLQWSLTRSQDER